MTHDPLHHAHRLVTASIMERFKQLDAHWSPDEIAASRDKLDQMRLVPVIGVHIDPRTQQLVLVLDKAHKPHAELHKQQLEAALGDLPHKIVYAAFEDRAAPAKNQAARPLWGGVKMADPASAGTLTLVVTKAQTSYTLISAHVVGAGVVGSAVGQPETGAGYLYGSVTLNPAGPRRASDSALASIDRNAIAGQVDKIWSAPNEAYNVVGKAQDAQLTVGTRVYMQGAYSPLLQSGSILATGVTSARPSGLVLTNQIVADYAAIPGDSGAPVFLQSAAADQAAEDANPAAAAAAEVNVIFAGIEVGSYYDAEGIERELFSPWSGIAADLGL